MNFDFYSVNEESKTLKLEGGKLSSLKQKNISKHGVRRFQDGQVFTSSVIGDQNEDELKESNLNSSKFGFDHGYGFCESKVEIRESSLVCANVLDEFAATVLELPTKYPNYVFNGSCSLINSKFQFKNDNGCDLSSTGGIADWYLLYQKVGSKNMMDGFLFQKSSKPDFKKQFEFANQFLDIGGNVAKIESKRLPVIFIDSFNVLTKLKESFLINRYKSGAALFSDKLGEQLFSEQVSIFDSGYAPDNGAIQFFDGEGVVREDSDFTVVENGVFKSVLSDLRLAKKYGVSSTANGVREFNTGCNLAARNLLFRPGEQPWEKIAKGFDKCLLAVVAAGGESNDLGEFSTPVQIGYVLKKGEIIGEAPQLTIKSNVRDFLGKDLISVSSDNYEGSNWYGLPISEVDVFVH